MDRKVVVKQLEMNGVEGSVYAHFEVTKVTR